MTAYAAGFVGGAARNWEYERDGIVYRTLGVEVPADGGSRYIYAVDQAGDTDDFLYVQPSTD